MSRSGGRPDGGVSIVERQSAPTGMVGASMFRWDAGGDLAALTSGTLYVVGVAFAAGQIVSNLTWVSGATAAVTPANQWSVLFTPARVQSAISVDAAAGAWAANTTKTFAMTTPYTIPTAGLYYAGLLVAAATPPTLRGDLAPTHSVIFGLPPILCGTSNAALTNPASCPGTANAITATAQAAYVYAT